jgi:hypothetical protein
MELSHSHTRCGGGSSLESLSDGDSSSGKEERVQGGKDISKLEAGPKHCCSKPGIYSAVSRSGVERGVIINSHDSISCVEMVAKLSSAEQASQASSRWTMNLSVLY